ncbi:SRPBCC family protein [Cohnella caldifontis]|uniref:SRPBCC family protein n=1 Tax=Cohnella caldifontis TaxID=3027471 RepID=UPI0023EAF2BB|nr:SRPBCC family protein [Cohnella sp. YIM B05605]
MADNAGANGVTKEIEERSIVVTRVFDAPRELVYRVWTDPNHLTQWWGPKGFTNTTHEFEARQGGVWRYTMHGPDGRDYPNKITFVKVDRPERLEYLHGDDGNAEHFRVTVTFAEQGSKTELTMRMLFPTAEQRDRTVKLYGAVEGLNQTLDRLSEQLRVIQEEKG